MHVLPQSNSGDLRDEVSSFVLTASWTRLRLADILADVDKTENISARGHITLASSAHTFHYELAVPADLSVHWAVLVVAARTWIWSIVLCHELTEGLSAQA
jgi:hypothetical protein